MAVSVAVCEIFSSKNGVTLKTGIQFVARPLEMAPFDRSHMSSYSLSNYSAVLYRLRDIAMAENREIFIPHLYLAPPKGVTPLEFREGV